MTAKEYLQQYLDLEKELNRALEQIEVERAKAEKITSTLSSDKVQSCNKDNLAKAVEKNY